MTILEAVKQAVKQVGHTDREDIIKYLLLEGINISPVNRVFRALDTIETGIEHITNSKKVVIDKKMLTEDNIEISEQFLEQRKARIRARYHRLKSEGICVQCGVHKVSFGRTTCNRCRLRSGNGVYVRDYGGAGCIQAGQS